jgi:DnaJ-like protein
MQDRYQDFLAKNRDLSERFVDEAIRHHRSAMDLLRRFPVTLFEPGGQFHHPGLWEEYQNWVDVVGCSDRLDQQTYWRFEDWDKRCHAYLRRVRWSQQKFDPGARTHQEPGFKRFLQGSEAIRRHYTVLGVKPSATNEEIRAAYRRLATEHHPDRDGGDTARMQQINVAYNELRRLRKF